MKTRLWMQGFGQIITAVLSSQYYVIAQVVPDQTLPVGERSQVSGDRNSQINGGAVRGNNLFHSFQQFSIPIGGSAAFNNSANITNILTRVTGGNISNIDGLIRANGTANLFLINPNGILLGANARLEIGGSFLASTANSLKFANGFEFSASNPQAPPLLTISAPIGLQYGNNPGAIQSQGSILQVLNGQTISLTGGNVAIDGGRLLAPGGRVELAGVAAAGEVGLTQQGQEWRLNIPDGLARADVAIADSALIDVTASGGGNVAITARNINILGSSDLTAGIADTSSSAVAQAGEITFNAAETVRIAEGSNVFNLVKPGGLGNAGGIRIVARSAELDGGAQLGSYTYGQGNTGDTRLEIADTLSLAGFGGNDGYTFIGNLIWPGGVGNTGDVIVSARSITLNDGSEIGAAIYGTGNAGDVRLSVSGTLSLAGRKLDGLTSGIGSQVLRGARGKGGNITIVANSIALNDGAGITSATNGIGDSGNITLEVSNTLSLSGFNPLTDISSTIQSLVGGRGAIGNGGNITIKAGSMIFTDGAFISSGLLKGARGKGGDIAIAANSIAFNDGAYIATSSFGQGNAGNVSLRVANTFSFAGSDRNGLSSAILSNVGRNGAGSGGDISIVADTLSLSDKAELASNNSGQGVAGNIRVQAQSVFLRQGARLTAETASGRGGDITLQNANLLVLRDGSSISSTAGTAQAGGDGGNITIDSKLIVAVPKENSNISANAFTGRGGNIGITTQGLFGIEPRSSTTTGLSSITASSQLGISGTIELSTPDIDPSRGIATLPTGITDINALIANSCVARRSRQGRFVITGTGGLVPQPDDLANSAFPTYELVPQPFAAASTSVMEADRIVRTATGEIVLGRSCQ